MAASARHETRALLRAHLSAASSFRHLTQHCPICHQLLQLAMDSPPVAGETDEDAMKAMEVLEDESPSPA
jgi:hypothetical protein